MFHIFVYLGYLWSDVFGENVSVITTFSKLKRSYIFVDMPYKSRLKFHHILNAKCDVLLLFYVKAKKTDQFKVKMGKIEVKLNWNIRKWSNHIKYKHLILMKYSWSPVSTDLKKVFHLYFSTELVRRVKRYQIANHSCLLIKYDKDVRYDEDNRVSTHDQ